MSPAIARPLLHTVHLLTFALLLGTGLLLFIPGLRAAVVGGYSLAIRQTHRWGGIAFAALPTIVIARFGARTIFAPPEQRTARSVWQGFHVAATVVMSAAFTLTGFVLWGKRLAPESLVESSVVVHDWLTYVVCVFVGLHLLDVGVAALATRFRAAAAQHSQI